MNIISPVDVFVTDGFPEHTYVPVNEGKKELEFKEGLEQKNKILSVSGPSKSGKTTLVEKFFGKSKGADLMYVTGDSIKDTDSLWNQAYRQVADDGDKPFWEITHDEYLDFLIGKKLPLVIDDYHFIPNEVQGAVSKQIKNAASAGLRIVCLSVPHRGDDPIRNNPDLSGRYFSVKFEFWTEADLLKIPQKGFPLVEFPMDETFNHLLLAQALRSPQIMQTLCLEACRMHGPDKPLKNVKPVPEQLPEVIGRTLRSYDHSSAVDLLRAGPQKRGKDRNSFKSKTGAQIDVYECLIAALKLDPPFQHLTLDDIRARVKSVLNDTKDPNVRSALQQYSELFESSKPPLDWDDEKRKLTIIDPHFYFYLRNFEN